MIRDITSQLKNSWNRARGCQCWLLGRFWGSERCSTIGIGWKSGKRQRISLIGRPLKCSSASSGGIRSLSSWVSTVESSGIDGPARISLNNRINKKKQLKTAKNK